MTAQLVCSLLDRASARTLVVLGVDGWKEQCNAKNTHTRHLVIYSTYCRANLVVVCVCVCARGVTGTIGGDSGAEPALYRASSL